MDKRKKQQDKVVVKEFTRLDQIMEFFPAHNLKADYLSLAPGKSLGAHRTLNQREVIGVLQGIGWVIVDADVYKLTKDQMIYIPKGKLCNVYNRNKLILKIIFIVSKLDS
jgi:mannose-6-phosphate isomerase-like protein (cupin superfamily)